MVDAGSKPTYEDKNENPTLTLMIDSNFISQHSFILLIHPYVCDSF